MAEALPRDNLLLLAYGVGQSPGLPRHWRQIYEANDDKEEVQGLIVAEGFILEAN